ncbi:MAG: ATP-binding protein, partial [Cellulosilyticaceae bacterium]
FATISVKNISKEQLSNIEQELTERFVRGDESRSTEGSGLGLAIATSLAQLQKGECNVCVDGDLFKVSIQVPLNV